MKCYRVYVDNEVVGTWFSLGQAIMQESNFRTMGYTNTKVEIEEY